MEIREPRAKLWIAEVMESMGQKDSTMVFVTLWTIWHARRKLIHEEIKQGPLSTHNFIQSFMKELESTSTPVLSSRGILVRSS